MRHQRKTQRRRAAKRPDIHTNRSRDQWSNSQFVDKPEFFMCSYCSRGIALRVQHSSRGSAVQPANAVIVQRHPRSLRKIAAFAARHLKLKKVDSIVNQSGGRLCGCRKSLGQRLREEVKVLARLHWRSLLMFFRRCSCWLTLGGARSSNSVV